MNTLNAPPPPKRKLCILNKHSHLIVGQSTDDSVVRNLPSHLEDARPVGVRDLWVGVWVLLLLFFFYFYNWVCEHLPGQKKKNPHLIVIWYIWMQGGEADINGKTKRTRKRKRHQKAGSENPMNNNRTVASWWTKAWLLRKSILMDDFRYLPLFISLAGRPLFLYLACGSLHW